MPPTTAQQTTMQDYFTEADAPTVIGTAEAQLKIVDTMTVAGRVLEQCGRSRRLLSLTRLSEVDPSYYQAAEPLAQALAAVDRDCNEIHRLLLQLAQHASQIDQGNVTAKAAATALGYTLT